MLAKPQGFPRKLGGCAGLDPRLRSAVSAGVGDGERGLRRGLRAPGVGVRPKWVLEYSPSNKRIRYFVSITYVRTGLWTAHKFCGGGRNSFCVSTWVSEGSQVSRVPWASVQAVRSSENRITLFSLRLCVFASKNSWLGAGAWRSGLSSVLFLKDNLGPLRTSTRSCAYEASYKHYRLTGRAIMRKSNRGCF